MLIRALLATDSDPLSQRLVPVLRDLGVYVATANSRSSELLSALSDSDIDLVLLSREALGERAEALIGSIRQLPDAPEIVIFTSDGDLRDRSRLMAAGCVAVLDAEITADALRAMLGNLLHFREGDTTRRPVAARTVEPASLADFSSNSPVMLRFLEVARRVVDASSSLLIMGETGVGKERLARAIHAQSPRSRGPFVAVNCGALPESLVESELFGHEKGAFTGSIASRRGYFELAHNGTIFLDEIAEIPLHLQVKLLRVLEERSFSRLGSERSTRIDVRVMAATNRDLETEMEAGRFRQDLYYRLAVVSLALPPLRDRPEDIPELANTYLAHFRSILNRPVNLIRDDAMRSLIEYPWPGNIRELINVIEQSVLLSHGDEIGLADLPRRFSEGRTTLATFSSPPDAVRPPTPLATRPFSEAKQELNDAFELQYLTEALTATAGRVGETARKAGISERTLYSLMRKHGLSKDPFRHFDG